MLSYNPLKSIDLNTFKWLAFSADNLRRVDLISNYETDWFVFDENDVCLLSHFKCGTKISIDMDQRCNCFVKYLHEISGEGRDRDLHQDTEDNAWFHQPCRHLEQSN